MSDTSPRPAILPPWPKNVPDTLRAVPQWVCWQAEWNDERGKWNKIPINARTGGNASSTDKSTWSTFEQAQSYYQRNKNKVAGIGIVLCGDDPLCGIDLDHAVANKKTCPVGPLDIDAQAIVDSVPTYWEVSPSGTGLRGFAIAALPPGGRKRGDIEMYESGRFLTVTGRKFGSVGTIEACQAEVSALHNMVWPPEPVRDRSAGGGTGLDGTDDELLQRAFTSATGAKIALLFGGSTVGYLGESEADLALCSLLAFWTGPDPVRLDSLFRASRLWRDKWDERRGAMTYGERTIRKAIDSCTEFYTPPGSRGNGGNGANGSGDVPPGESGTGGADGTGGGRYRNSDTGNAERFVDQHGASLRYDHDAKSWYVFDGRVWRKDGNGLAQEKAKDTVIGIYVEAGREPDEDKRKALAAHAKASDKAQRIGALMTLACSDARVSVTASVWDRDGFLLNCQNGTVNLRTGQLQPHDPADMITKMCSVEFDPDATCPLWDACLTRWQPDEAIRAFLQRAAGYTLTGDIGEETAFFLFGVGRNGKSKFTGALESIMGNYAARLKIDTLMESQRTGNTTPDLIPCIGARLVIASELPEGKRINEGFVKDLTGGDKLTANPKYANVIEFRPKFKLWLYGNHKPNIKGTDDGIWSRLPFVPFTVTIPKAERDPELDTKLLLEGPGILAWAVRGCQQWQKERLSPPPAVIEATEEYRQESDTLTGFWEDHCVFMENAWTPNAVIRDAYLKWCDREMTRFALSAPAFGERLKQKGCTAVRRRHAGEAARGWLGVALKAEDDGFGDPFTETSTDTGGADVNGVNTVNGQNSETPNLLHTTSPGEVSVNDTTPVHTVHALPTSSTSLREKTLSVNKEREEKKEKTDLPSVETGPADDDLDLEDPFADDPRLTFSRVQERGVEVVEATLTGDGWALSATGRDEAEAISELRGYIAAPTEDEALQGFQRDALEEAVAVWEMGGDR